jgi:hypothetical protein
MLEAFFHARYFLEMACKYGKELEETPDVMSRRLGGGAVFVEFAVMQWRFASFG